MVSIVKPAEMMVVEAAREIRNSDVVFVGMRLPLIAFCLAKATHAPDAVGVFENGLYRDRPSAAPIVTMCDPPNITGALCCTTLRQAMGLLQQGRITLGFIGGAQVDVYGNLNTTQAGNKRLPGSGGAADIASLAQRVVMVMPHEARRLVDKVDRITSPGFGNGPGWREALGLSGGGPTALVTTYGVFRFDPVTKRAILAKIFPDATLETIRAETGWPLETASDVVQAPLPSLDELAWIRRFDPRGYWTRRK